MRSVKNKKSLHVALAAFMALSTLTTLGFVQEVSAATAALGEVYVRFDRMKVSTATTGTVCAKPSATNLATTDAKVVVTLPTGYTLGAFGTFTVNTTSTNMAWPTGGTAWPGITAPTGSGDISGQSVTFASSDLSSSSTLYCFNWTNSGAVSEPSSANPNLIGSVTTKDGSSVTIDTAQYATAAILDDQVVVTATVPPAFAFSLNANVDNFGTLTAATVTPSPTPVVARVDTNAKNGWMMMAKDSNAGLTSANASYTIPSNCSSGAGSNSTLSTSTEAYNLGITTAQTSGSQTPAATAVFLGGSLGKGGGLCSSNLQTIASSTGTANNATVTMTNNVNVIGSTPAATDYTDTITVVGAGLF